MDVLRTRVAALVAAKQACNHDRVGSDLPGLIRDLYTSMAVGRVVAELLTVAVMLRRQRREKGYGRAAPGHPAGGVLGSLRPGRWPGCEGARTTLRRAKLISPTRVQCNPFTREVIAELLVRSRRDVVGRELRGMAYRAGLPV